MHDESFDALIDAAARRVNVPPETLVDEMWAGITAARHRPRRPAWAPWIGIAAGLVLAFVLGRATVESPRVAAVTSPAPSGAAPVVRVTTQLLGASAVLLSGLDQSGSEPMDGQRFARQAGELLATTRLLLDTRSASTDLALRSVLEDLELLLAQLARVKQGEAPNELQLIHDAMQARDIVPRIRTVSAHLAGGAD